MSFPNNSASSGCLSAWRYSSLAGVLTHSMLLMLLLLRTGLIEGTISLLCDEIHAPLQMGFSASPSIASSVTGTWSTTL